MTITLRAVLEVPYTAPTAVPWPVAAVEPGAWLPLDGSCDDLQIGLFAAVVADYNDVPPGEPATAAELIAPGGLLLAGPATTIVPGCCSGLERWRDWAAALTTGEPPWLGHDPTPAMTIGERITIWQDAGPPDGAPPVLTGPHLTVTRAELADLLRGVHRDLTAFATVLAGWADRHTADGPAFTAAIGAMLAISGPLALGPA